jgi:hypothetical protein
MPQLSLYVDDETLEILKKSAQSVRVSMSKFAAEAIREKSEHRNNGWPDGYEKFFGCLNPGDFPSPEELKGSWGGDAYREEIN